LIPTPVDDLDEWLRVPVPAESSDPRFVVRRATPDEFERIYDVVDAAFEKKRPRAQYDWLYRENPFGVARCWVVTERATGEILRTGAYFGWPIWRGNNVLMGSLSGDAGTLPQWQRKGLAGISRAVRRAHPWYDETCGFAGPNAASRSVLQNAGESRKLLGALRGGVVPLQSRALLEHVGAHRMIASPAGAVAGKLLSAWRDLVLRGARGAPGRVERVDRFTVDYDDVTERCMYWPKFWSPHNADFLNWRYLDHPVESYVAIALVEDERPTGYAVLCLEGEKATLTEFAVETESRARALKLLSSALRVAQEADCASLNFFGTSSWRHWPLFYRSGFLPYKSKNHLEVFGVHYEPEVHDQRNWQITPGDRDYR
jgi:hypothetical protein